MVSLRTVTDDAGAPTQMHRVSCKKHKSKVEGAVDFLLALMIYADTPVYTTNHGLRCEIAGERIGRRDDDGWNIRGAIALQVLKRIG